MIISIIIMIIMSSISISISVISIIGRGVRVEVYISGLATGPLRKGFVGLWILSNMVWDNCCNL